MIERVRELVVPPAISFVDGRPDVTGLAVETFANSAGREQLRRYVLKREYRFGSVMIHELLEADPDPMHDHPWAFTSVLLRGGYREVTPDGVAEWWAPVVLNRPARWVHRLEPLDGPTWTLISTGPVEREWGYHVDGGWCSWRRFHGLAERRW